MKVKIKKLVEEAVIPSYSKPGDAGMDITAISKSVDKYGNIVYGTGLAFEIPEGFFMMLVPRSSNSKKQLLLTNSCGIIDSGYRGEVSFKFAEYESEDKFFSSSELPYEISDRIGQAIILPYPVVEFMEVEELKESERGAGGYGSTGR